MDAEKEEFGRLIELMGWSQSEAARRLRKTPSAINHLLNSNHPNRPTQTTLQLLKLIIASERPDLFDSAFELKDSADGSKPPSPKLTPKELALIERIRKLTPEEQAKVYAVINAMLNPKRGGGSQGKG